MPKNQGKHNVKFMPSGRGKARCPPDPRFPNGVGVGNVTDHNKPYCSVDLPYPAPECGVWNVMCETCGFRLIVTAAGRPDDPKFVQMECLTKKEPDINRAVREGDETGIY